MLKALILSLALGLTLVVALTPAPALAQFNQAKEQACRGAGGDFRDGQCITRGGESTNLEGIIRTVANILVFIVGAVAVIMLIIGGFKYVISGGDSAGVEGAKNTIIYAVVGLVIAFAAYAIVNFFLGRLVAGGR